MQGRFKRDGSAAAEQEPRGGTDRGSSPQHTQNQGPAAPGASGDRAARLGAAAPAADGAKAPLKPKGPTDTGSRIALRNWRISTRLVSLLALPVVAATTLGGLRINESMADMKQLEHMQLLTEMTKQATDLASRLQAERDLSAGPLSNDPTNVTDSKVTGPRAETDRARKAFLEATRDIPNAENDDALESIRANANQIAVQVNQLTTIRENAYADDDTVPHSLTVDKYSRLVESLLSLSQDMAQATSNPDMIKRTRALAAFSSAKEYASIQRAIIAAALPGGGGEQAPGLNENDRLYGKAARESGETQLKAFKAVYESYGGNSDELTEPMESGNPTIEVSEQYAKRVLDTKNGLATQDARSYLDWTDDYSARINAMKTIEATLLGQMEGKARELRDQSQREAIINGALILVVLGVSLVGAFVVARSMIRSLRRLQDTATKVAQDRLPELVKQLSESDPQDVDTSVESVGVHSRDEIGQVAAAFDDVHREAVRLAAEQALLRGNVNAMFTNLSRRSQGLIQRQLSLISELESREADPDQLSSLFKLDHLATRMRRNGENLLVLAGEEPGRRWTRPVPLVDVLRAAASEVEQYERIELSSVPATEVAGRVVNDLVHLLAELLENATSFSSPQTKVRVTGHALPDGRVLVEIHDTGIGLSPEDLAAINERLASPPTVDVSVSRRMGLFVVGRLSLRHGIRIQLRPSDSGGTTALVMLPVDVANGGKKAPNMPGASGQGAVPPGQNGPAGVGGRPAGGPGANGGGRSGLGGPPAGGPGGAPAGGRMGTGAPRGQVGAGAAPRAALPARDGAPASAPRHAQGQGQGQGGGLGGAFGSGAGRGAQNAPARGEARKNGFQQGAPGTGDRGRQLPAPGGPRAELPGGKPPRRDTPSQRPQAASWGSEQPSAPQQRPSADAPRGHDDNESARGPAATAEFARPDFNAPPPRGGGSTGQFVRPDVYGSQDPSSTGQFARPGTSAPQPPAPSQAPRPRGRDNTDYSVPRPANALPPQPQPEALPPAGPGDGRTPLYDTLETNWFHGPQSGQPAEQPQAPAVPQQPAGRAVPPMPQRSPAPAPATPGNAPNASGAAWRTSPNDELVRQAERVRKPAAGGVTTSGLPRRVPRANLVPGTAQEQTNQAGPQVSRAPDDVRGRLTNLRRGIQQGRQQNSSTTGSFNLGPTHQQER
ncbi:nitrate- and nitrite sensing domain-containing protein [Streptomyces lunaelactis]|uniref:nitrate- and nitrite sensing domain-containing protein n=1 Tax=Streptomyces lunaelactis TaxID=1535768 RepID=UPI001584682E|nr:nitrate- and nitrite sensing domain-containing protein [Streptomyces lunaelactis]NUK08478.1 nitrate- and nitrite sensing domain-containing protein [Streptomyces lunaelactis]NUK34379.1 nitrate- and nitrite sensing domain-containing protein [Streptomyces lunaelactis]NUK39932.1 nitrate- and nitrite sensing domain-containing protein [Streptomyces lunaelactis]NUK50294.1 nitrate- and nitrite sensing domain-containing protein [Streptomyces lunaelactis]NUK57393.1 nitrate- and nitrite sensing domain